jgi:hypothetical protein
MVVGIAAVLCCLVGLSCARVTGSPAEEGQPVAQPEAAKEPVADPAVPKDPETKEGKTVEEASWSPAVEPKPLSEQVKKGLAWLVRTQHDNGGWSQGEESQQMGQSLAHLKDKPNVADTCVATLALMRAGSTPSTGPHADNVRRGIEFICCEIEESDKESLYVTSVRGTRVQTKLGPYIDTFLASMVLAEAKGHLPDSESNQRVAAALDKVLSKIERNQKEDGTWDNTGWAPALSQSMASKGLNRAAQGGAMVSPEVRARAEQQAVGQFDKDGKKFKAEGSAGVDLYASAASLGAMQDSVNTNAQLETEVRKKAETSADAKEREEAQRTLQRFDEARQSQAAAQQAVVEKLSDQKFIQGFGSNGGEEFLSYMNISESLVVKGGEEWEEWDAAMTRNLNHVQNEDGSWTGHHCITGRTFCTAAALLVLTADRAPVPVAAKVRRG